MSKRFQNALTAQNGACNPRAIAQGLVDAIDECRAENVEPGEDPAVFLILHQLTFVLTGHDYALTGDLGGRWYGATMALNLKLADLERK